PQHRRICQLPQTALHSKSQTQPQSAASSLAAVAAPASAHRPPISGARRSLPSATPHKQTLATPPQSASTAHPDWSAQPETLAPDHGPASPSDIPQPLPPANPSPAPHPL